MPLFYCLLLTTFYYTALYATTTEFQPKVDLKFNARSLTPKTENCIPYIEGGVATVKISADVILDHRQKSLLHKTNRLTASLNAAAQKPRKYSFLSFPKWKTNKPLKSWSDMCKHRPTRILFDQKVKRTMLFKQTDTRAPLHFAIEPESREKTRKFTTSTSCSIY